MSLIYNIYIFVPNSQEVQRKKFRIIDISFENMGVDQIRVLH